MGQKFYRNRIITVSKIKAFLHFTQKFKMAAKMVGNDFEQKVADDSAETLWAKNFSEIALSRTVSEILQIFHFHRGI